MTVQRGRVECMASLLMALRMGPLYHSQLRRQTRLDGSTIYKHIEQLKQQGLIRSWKERSGYGPDLRYYRLTAEGHAASRYVQTTLEWLGLPASREMQR